MRINKIILISSFLFSLLSGFKQPSYCKLSDKIFFSYNKEICKKNGLRLVGKGGAMMDDVKQINSHYESFDSLTVDEARRLFVDVVEGYLEHYNQNEEIRPYLHNYPFTVDNVDVTIGFRPINRQKRDPSFVALMYVGKNQRLLYRDYNHETEKFTDLYEEPYETAREIVQRERASLCQ